MGYFNPLSYVLSRLAFVGTHLVFVYWLNFLLNDPFDLATLLPAPYGKWVNTLDVRVVQPSSKCTPIIKESVVWNVLVFAGW